MEMRVDAEIAVLFPPLTPDEYAALETSILAEGVRDPLVVWAEQDILLDGHNRKSICDRHELSFTVRRIGFDARDAAIEWALRNQLGRRNLPPDAASLMRGRLYNMQKSTGHGAKPAGQSVLQNDTSERLSDQLGVTARTIRRDGQFADAIEALTPYMPDIAQQAMAGDLPSRKAVIEAAKAPALAAHQLISQSRSNEWYTPSEYVDAARAVMGEIDTDPASNSVAQEWIGAGTYYTADDDGLAHEWGGRCWLNPPWGRLTPDFIGKLIDERQAGRVKEAVVLVNAHATDTNWFDPLWDGLLCFTNHRINYASATDNGGGSGGSTHGSVFVYFGGNRAGFIREFSRWGAIVERARQV